MHIANKAERLELFNFRSLHTRVFHLSWMAFFLCFFAWFAIAPLMPVIRQEFALSKAQIGNTIIASVAMTMIMRIVIGWLCDRIGPRITYSALLCLGSLPVMGIACADDYRSFLLFRLAIGAIGASFVITQYHTTAFYAARCVGTANATSAGWGTLGGGVAQVIMPLVFSLFIGAGISAMYSWRLSMVVVGLLCALMGVAYFFLTQDRPDGNFADVSKQARPGETADRRATFAEVCSDKRVWGLSLAYGTCFGVELTMHNMAALYFTDYFKLSLTQAGLMAGSFGMMNIFARSLGGLLGDKAGKRSGLNGRISWLALALLLEGLALMLFSRATGLFVAVGLLVLFSLFVQMSEGATFAIVPFVNPHAVGAVSGIVGAGGNAGAVMAGFLFKGELPWPTAFLILGATVVFVASLIFWWRFSQGTRPRSSLTALSDSAV